jgi:hypothetical protein
VTHADEIDRRQAIFGTVAALSVLGLSTKTLAHPTEEISHSDECIHQEPVFKASRKRVYEALTDAQEFDKVEKLSADMQGGGSLGLKPTEISR